MSDEWKEEFFEWKDQIESKYNDLSESKIKCENKIKALEKKLNGEIESKLSERIHTLNKMDSNSAKVEQDLQKQIAELSDSLQKCGVKWDFRLDELGGFIDELKDNIIKMNGDDSLYQHILINRDVLREFYSLTDSLASYFASKYETEIALTIRTHRKRIKEKLDSKAERINYEQKYNTLKRKVFQTTEKTEKKDSASEKELGLPKRENGLNHSHGKSEGNSPLLNSKFPEPPFYECMKCNSIHHSLALNQDDEGNNICPDCGSKNFKTPKEKPEPEAFPKIVYQLGSDSKEYIELKEKYDKLIEDFKVDINEYLNSTNIEKGTRDYRYWWGRLAHWKGRIK